MIHLEDDLYVDQITPGHISAFLASQNKLSKKTISNYHVGLSALWTWMMEENLAEEHIPRQVKRPKPEKRAIVPFTEADIKELLSALGKSKPYSRPGKRECSHTTPQPLRNQAIIFLLLDTGIRASELCGLRIKDIDLKNRRIMVFGKGAKERSVPFGPRTGTILWKYITTREDAKEDDDYLFITVNGEPMTDDRLYKVLKTLGKRAGVRDVHPHRFRHTFAISFLRNNGNPWALQMALGHSTMDMVSVYLALAQADLDTTHKKASPVENWRL